MKISTFGYTIKQGIKNIWTNKMFSIASIATMAACIFMFGMFYAIVANFQHVVKDVESSVAITVFSMRERHRMRLMRSARKSQ